MVKTGIDTLAIYTARYSLDLAELAKARQVDTDKFRLGLGQYQMSVPPPGEDIVTMAANAAEKVLTKVNANDIDMLLFATESGIDQSKAAGIYVHSLLHLKPNCRIVELKQACYSGTAALQLALSYVQMNPSRKVLVIASDIARYGLNTPGESSQGCGAVAFIVSANPRLLMIEPGFGVITENVMDFWRPNYLHEAVVEGKYSSKLYLAMLEKVWKYYQTDTNRTYSDHDFFCYHTPVPRLVEKAHKHLSKMNDRLLSESEISKILDPSLSYGRQLGNSYTASLYIGFASLIDNINEDISGKRIGFYSYGSGCVAEYFSGIISDSYHDVIFKSHHQSLLKTRKALNYDEYVAFYSFNYIEDGGKQEIPFFDTGNFRLQGLNEHKRSYESLHENCLQSLPKAEGMR